MTSKNEDYRGHLLTHAHELVKQYIELDASLRAASIYTAHTNAKDGEECLKTDYVYEGATSIVRKRKESKSSWDATWDI